MTLHGILRAEERAGLSPAGACIMTDLAVANGRCFRDFKDRERRYLIERNHDGNTAIVYNRFCFILSCENTLITMYPVPAWFEANEPPRTTRHYFDGKRLVRHPKKYFTRYKRSYVLYP